MNFVALCSNTHICSKTRVLPAFTQVYFLSLFLHPVSPGLTFLGWKTPPLIAAEDDDDFWSMIVSSLASITYPEEQAKNIESRCLYVCIHIYIYINLLAWVCAALCVTVCVRVCLGECGVPVNTYSLRDSFADQWQTDITCISEYSFLYFPVSFLLPFTFPPRIRILPLNLQSCASHYLPMAFCDLCFCSCLSFFSSSLPCLLHVPKLSPKFGSSFRPSFNFLTL